MRPRPLALAALAGGALLLAACSPSDPQLTVFADGRSETVAPTLYCPLDLDATKCTVGGTAQLRVPAGSPLQLSVPASIADAPWRLIAIYQSAAGEQREDQQVFRSGETFAVTVESPDPTEQLLGVEVQLPSSVVDDDGVPIARATWGVATSPS